MNMLPPRISAMPSGQPPAGAALALGTGPGALTSGAAVVLFGGDGSLSFCDELRSANTPAPVPAMTTRPTTTGTTGTPREAAGAVAASRDAPADVELTRLAGGPGG